MLVNDCQHPHERLPESAIAVQIDTTLHRSEIRISHGFQRFDLSFDRTAVSQGHEQPAPCQRVGCDRGHAGRGREHEAVMTE